MPRQFLNYMFCKKLKKIAQHHRQSSTRFPLLSFSSHATARRPSPHSRPRNSIATSKPRHRAIILATAMRPRHAHTATGTRREKVESPHLTNVEADRRGRAGARGVGRGGGPHGRARWRAARGRRHEVVGGRTRRGAGSGVTATG